MKSLLLMFVLGAIFLRKSLGKPTEMIANSDLLDPVASAVNGSEIETTREQRSPQFGLIGGYGDYYDYNDDTRYFRYGNRRKYYYKHHRPHGLVGGHGCRGYGCGGGYAWQPEYGGYHHTGQGASFASASAGSIGGGGPYGGGHGQANAQSASFNIGPFSASFSAAQSSSGQNGF
ncbi:PREDICTED: keratin, type I cytoskeletal 9-like [Vollenhovia emeryi]|uniref:keratin, type I cytoskeletal 9-like n=1 Tax=Vollenhovia emeryi TaxID=411798 RepID=UPI0005F437C4|nr:PREDICTED: keratin, type I cytoskeletal 9-like [Vollenhovia emeryi]